MRESATANTPLPPSIEKAYHQKCIDMKRRLREIEESNDATRLRKHRLDRSITKMRLMRAFLLEQLVKNQEFDDAPESERSESPPPTVGSPQPGDRPPRVKRSYQRRSPPVNGRHSSIPSPPPGSAAPYGTPGNPSFPHQSLPMQHMLSTGRQSHLSTNLSHLPGTSIASTIHLRSPASSLAYPRELPLINSLPNGTSVMLVGPGEPKRGPWTIRDLGPQHHFKPGFESWAPDVQELEIFGGQDGPYLPYDLHGNAIMIEWDEALGRYKHVFATDPTWVNPVANGVRMDDPEHGRRRIVAEKRAAALELERERGRVATTAATEGRDASEVGRGAGALEGAKESATPPVARAERGHANGASSAATAAAGSGASSGGGFTAVNR